MENDNSNDHIASAAPQSNADAMESQTQPPGAANVPPPMPPPDCDQKPKAKTKAKPKKNVAKSALERRNETRSTQAEILAKPAKSKPKSKQQLRILDKPIGIVSCDKEKWVLSLDFRRLDVRHVNVHIGKSAVNFRAQYRTHKNVWKDIVEEYRIPANYPFVSGTKKNGILTIVARDCKGGMYGTSNRMAFSVEF